MQLLLLLCPFAFWSAICRLKSARALCNLSFICNLDMVGRVLALCLPRRSVCLRMPRIANEFEWSRLSGALLIILPVTNKTILLNNNCCRMSAICMYSAVQHVKISIRASQPEHNLIICIRHIEYYRLEKRKKARDLTTWDLITAIATAAATSYQPQPPSIHRALRSIEHNILIVL